MPTFTLLALLGIIHFPRNAFTCELENASGNVCMNQRERERGVQWHRDMRDGRVRGALHDLFDERHRLGTGLITLLKASVIGRGQKEDHHPKTIISLHIARGD